MTPHPAGSTRPAPSADTFESVVSRRFGRRSLFKGAAALGVVALVPTQLGQCGPEAPPPADLTFLPIAPDATDTITGPARLPVRRGDRLGRPAVRRRRALRHHQARRRPSRPGGSASTATSSSSCRSRTGRATSYNRALLWNNHEYTDAKLMFPGLDPAPTPRSSRPRSSSRPTAAP